MPWYGTPLRVAKQIDVDLFSGFSRNHGILNRRKIQQEGVSGVFCSVLFLGIVGIG